MLKLHLAALSLRLRQFHHRHRTTTTRFANFGSDSDHHLRMDLRVTHLSTMTLRSTSPESVQPFLTGTVASVPSTQVRVSICAHLEGYLISDQDAALKGTVRSP